jgi:hypothetical protein
MVVSLRPADEEFKLTLVCAGGNQLVPGLLAEGLHVLERAGIGCGDGQRFPRSHGGQGFLGTQNWQGAIHAAGIERLRSVRAHRDAPLLVDDRSVKKIGKKMPDENDDGNRKKNGNWASGPACR